MIKSYEKGGTSNSTVGEVWFRPEDHQLVRPVIIVRGKKPSDDEEGKDDYYDIVEVGAGRAADAETRRVRLQARRLRLI